MNIKKIVNKYLQNQKVKSFKKLIKKKDILEFNYLLYRNIKPPKLSVHKMFFCKEKFCEGTVSYTKENIFICEVLNDKFYCLSETKSIKQVNKIVKEENEKIRKNFIDGFKPS